MLAYCALLFLVFTVLFPVEQKYEKSFTCTVLDQDDESYRDQVTVTFTGTYTDRFLRKDKFVGRIDIEGYEFLSPDASDREFVIGNYEESWIAEYLPSTIEPEVNYLGTLYATEDFESFFMWLNVPTDETKGYPGGFRGRYFVTFPEMTFEEIYSLLDKING